MEARILQLIESSAGELDPRVTDDAFERVALDVFRYQFERVTAYRRFCEGRSVDPDRVRTWQEIPAIPLEAFKAPLVDGGSKRPHVFLSSGTTQGLDRRSRHELESPTTYRASSMAHFARMVLPDKPGPLATLILGPTGERHPHSSLGHMYSWCAETNGDGESYVAFGASGTVDLDRAVAWLAERQDHVRPVLILAVSSALTALFDALRTRDSALRLPAASRIVDTGGPKGARVLSAKGMLRAAWRFLGIPAYLSVNEYGMTEMLSQFYDDGLASRYDGYLGARSKLGPAWVRTETVSPATLERVAPGEKGLLRHVDLANWETVSALQTLDIGRMAGRGFELDGRAPAAESRGCSQLMAAVETARTGAEQ